MRNITLVSSFVMNLICLAAMLIGVLIAISPMFLEAGIVGWYNGFKVDPATNILGLQSFGWLVCNVLSFLLGVAIVTITGFLGISLGITSAIIRLASQKPNTNSTDEQAKPIQRPLIDGSKDESR